MTAEANPASRIGLHEKAHEGDDSRPTDKGSTHTYGVVVFAFDPTDWGDEYMRLEVNDVVECIAEEDGWWFGRRVDPKNLSVALAEGWFPPSYVEKCEK